MAKAKTSIKQGEATREWPNFVVGVVGKDGEKADHDQRVKCAVEANYADFCEAFHPDLAKTWDFSKSRLLNKETFFNPPQDDRGYIDVVTSTPRRHLGPGAPSNLILPTGTKNKVGKGDLLLHHEFEARPALDRLRHRMGDYWRYLVRKYGDKVAKIYSFSVGLRVGAHGQVQEEYTLENEFNHYQFEWPHLGFPGMDGQKYLEESNAVGAAFSVFMRIDPNRRAWHKAEAVVKIAQASHKSDYQKYLLGEIVGFYLPLNDHEQAQFDQILRDKLHKGANEMTTTWFGQGYEKGIRTILFDMATMRFGTHPGLDAWIDSLDFQKLHELKRTLLDPSATLEELGWIPPQTSGQKNGNGKRVSSRKKP